MTYSERVVKLAIHILNKVISLTNVRKRSDGSLNFKPLAKWLLNDLKCGEEEFVLALAYLRDTHLKYYNCIDIPSKYDGCSHIEFAHLFIETNEVTLEAIDFIPKIKTEGVGWIGPYQVGDTFTVPKDVGSRFIRLQYGKKIVIEADIDIEAHR